MTLPNSVEFWPQSVNSGCLGKCQPLSFCLKHTQAHLVEDSGVLHGEFLVLGSLLAITCEPERFPRTYSEANECPKNVLSAKKISWRFQCLKICNDNSLPRRLPWGRRGPKKTSDDKCQINIQWQFTVTKTPMGAEDCREIHYFTKKQQHSQITSVRSKIWECLVVCGNVNLFIPPQAYLTNVSSRGNSIDYSSHAEVGVLFMVLPYTANTTQRRMLN